MFVAIFSPCCNMPTLIGMEKGCKLRSIPTKPKGIMVRKPEREPKPVIEYIRVSTAQQGKSGLGLEAQRENIGRFCKQEGFTVVESFVEIESAKGDTLARRPKLAAALKAAKRLKDDDYGRPPIIVAKLDRLSRDVHFISGLMTERVPFAGAGGAEAALLRRSAPTQPNFLGSTIITTTRNSA
jgi:hypothetical protein